MKKNLARLLCALAFGYLSINFVSNKTGMPGFFQTPALGAGAMSGDKPPQCTRELRSNSINVTCQPYNAVPNDSLDDSQAFQAAVDSLPPSGGTISIPSGTYLFTKPLIIQKPVHLTGAGLTTILTHAMDLTTDGQANFIRIGGRSAIIEGVTISELTLQGPQQNQLRTPMIRIVSNTRNVKIRDVAFKNVSSTCVLIYGNNIKNIEVSNNRAEEFYEQFVEFGTGGIAGVRIEHNVAKSTRGHPKLGSTQPFGVVFEPHDSGEITDILISGNTFSFDGMTTRELINTGGISLSTGDPHSFVYRGVVLKDNVIRTAGVGIRVQTLRSQGVSTPGSVIIEKNRIEGSASYGILVNARGDGHDAVSITENIIRGYSAQAYYQYDGIRVEGNSVREIRSNQVLPLKEDGSNIGRYGISIDSESKKVVVKDNKISGYHVGAISNKSAN